MKKVNIIGAGLSGLSAALTLAKQGIPSRLISIQQSERAQSNLAEGGINAVLDVMGEADTVDEHFADTMRGGCNLADPAMVRGLVEAAPEIVRELERLGVPFHRENGHIVQRNFGGQMKKRTAYAKSSTGKVLAVALIDAVRKYEVEGLVERFPHHRFERMCIAEIARGEEVFDGENREWISEEEGLFDGEKASDRKDFYGKEKFSEEVNDRTTKRTCTGVQVFDEYNKQSVIFDGPVIVCCGGMNGMFYGGTTGTTANTGSVAALLFAQGVAFANLEFLQYHPTTAHIPGKRLLISEAARGEGGRLFVYRDGKEYYFMEEKYGERGNLMPRDVVSWEMVKLAEPVYLDLRGLSKAVWVEKLPDLKEEIEHYLGIDPAKEPVPVSPGIHYFMGGIRVDAAHRTNVEGLYAAGECACAYHGANRLGGNSLLGAIYGGHVAAETVARELKNGDLQAMEGKGVQQESSFEIKKAHLRVQKIQTDESVEGAVSEIQDGIIEKKLTSKTQEDTISGTSISTIFLQERKMETEMEQALLSGLSVLRTKEEMDASLSMVRQLMQRSKNSFSNSISEQTGTDSSKKEIGQNDIYSDELSARLLLAEAFLKSALARKESRGAHTRLDFPDASEVFHKTTVAWFDGKEVRITFEEIPSTMSLKTDDV